MSFNCYVTGQHVKGKTKVLVPILKRKVEYQKVLEKTDRNNESSILYVGEPTYGWETVLEVPTTREHEESLKSQYINNFELNVKKVFNKITQKDFFSYKDKQKQSENNQQENSYEKD